MPRRRHGLLLGFVSVTISVVQSQPIADGGRSHWAFLPPRASAPPAVRDTSGTRHPIDAFVLHRLEAQGRRFAPEVRPSTLVRRLHLDLTGLPPAPETTTRFLHERHPQAYERLVDRLLASPAFGERMATYWLDLARYADTTGHAADMPRTMWLYRDWVVDAFNENLPHDRFTVLQLAGDMLPGAGENERIATGFHRNAPQALGNNPRKEEFRVKGIVDRLDVTGQVWLGLTLVCAECHDHKYDPISTKEYYQLFAIFNNVPHKGERFDVHGPRLEVERIVNGKSQTVQAQVMAELEEARPTFVHVRGHFESRGERVEPAFPAALPTLLPDGKRPNRLTFAQWLVHPEHPLTARVEVNRLWQLFFHHGLVKTANDFGLRGEAPSHPGLLDWLAVDFQRGEWDRKRLIRDIVSSTTYRQSSAASPEARAADPGNRLLARAARFRLPAEAIRDQALAVSGLLVRDLGGPSVFPPQPEGVGQFRDATAGKWETSEGADRYRRSLYTFWQRMSPYPSLALLGAPGRETCTVRREDTNTPLQALVTFNDPVFVEAARALGARLARLDASFEKRLEHGFLLCLSRFPTNDEVALFREFHAQQDEDWSALAAVLLNLDECLTRE